MIRSWMRAVAAVVVLMCAASAPAGVGLGDEAPALEILEWAKGDPVDLGAFKGKNVVVLDFFVTLDTRLPEQMKHLATLQDKWSKAGLKVVGISTETAETVKRFVAANEFKYPVAVDNMRNTCGTYIPDGEPPHTVIIDKEGRVVWGGYVAGLDAPLEKVMSGKFDLERVKKTVALERELGAQWNTKDPDKIEPAADAVLAHDPNIASAMQLKRWCFASRENPKGYREWIVKHVAKLTEAPAMNEVAWELVTADSLAWREASAALAASAKAVEMTQGKEAALIDTLARVYYEIGLVDRAIETQQKAIAALAATATEAEKKQYQEILGYYQACAALGKTVKPDVKKPDPKKKP